VRTAVNLAIVVGLAALIAFLPGAGVAASMFIWLIAIVFWAALAWFVARLYREYRDDVYGLGDRMRAVLYVSVGAMVVAVAATAQLWETPAGLLAWFVLVGAGIYGVFAAWRQHRSY
jgi:surface polysaccharide O-acyltransferase-like enzyme